MKSRVQRWDVVVGGFASLVAVAGLLLSIKLGNTASLGLGHFHRDTQEFMAMLAAMFLILVAIKAGLRYRRTCQSDHGTCGSVSNVCSIRHEAWVEAELGPGRLVSL